MPLTVNDYALICDKVYDESQSGGGTSLVPGFACTRLVTDPVNGFKGAIYTRQDDCVVAFKGTEPTKTWSQMFKDLAADYRLAVGGIPKQVAPAAKLLDIAVRNHSTKTIVICGHSLGGGLAQVVGFQTGTPFITFNAPPMATNVDDSWAKTVRSIVSRLPGGSLAFPLWSRVAQFVAKRKNLGDAFGVNLRMKGDIVSSASWGGDHVGKVIEIPTNLGAGEAHLMGAVRQAIERNIGMKQVIVT